MTAVNAKRNTRSRNTSNLNNQRGAQDTGSLESMFDSAIDGVQSVGKSVTGAFRAENVVPIAIGSFVVGVAAGVLGALYLPKLSSSEFVSTLGTKLNQAKDSVGGTFTQAKDTVMKAVKDATSDSSLKSTVAGNNGVSSSSRLA